MQIHWKKLTFGDLGQIITGKTPSTQNSLFWDGNIPFITPKDIQSSKHILKTERYLSQDGAYAVKSSILPKDSICVSCIGNIGYIGKTTKLSVSNQQINSIIPNQYNDSDFIYYLMKSLWVYFKNYEGQSTALSILNKSQFSNIEISIPPLDVQKKIAGVLGALDDKIELNNKINQNLEAQAQALFKSWFIDFEPFGGKMPNDWKIGKLGDIADITSGKRPLFKSNIKTSNALIPIVGASGVMGYTKEYLYNNKILVTGRVGTHGIIQRFNKTCWPSDNTLIISSNFYEYVYNYLKIIDFSSMNRGSTQPLITQSDLKKCDIIIPSRLFLDKFEKNVSILFDLKDKNTQEIENLAELRDTLLPKLMNGEIDVDNVKID